ncbi:Repressible high-affinity phosphate permease [Exophiala dermatitidis]
MPRWRGRLYATDRARDFDHEHDRQIRVRQIYETIDRQPFQWVVVLVAGVGFLLDGFSLFAGNIALPMIAYVYWQKEVSSFRLTCINIATLSGTLLGQVLFGFLADLNGRKKMYGIELVLHIGSTLGVVMCSQGYNGNMSIYAWLIWWRFMVGVGVGADYPLSATITAEFAPRRHRARMMATVFFMQPLGQIAGNLVSLVVVSISRRSDAAATDLAQSVDTMWRWIIGIGVVPGVVALLFRFAIPETPRFLVDIEDDPIKAEFDATQLFGEESLTTPLTELEAGMGGVGDGAAASAWSTADDDNILDESHSPTSKSSLDIPFHRKQSSWATSVMPISPRTASTAASAAAVQQRSKQDSISAATVSGGGAGAIGSPLNNTFTSSNANPPSLPSTTWTLTKGDIKQYFWTEGNWRTLVATSVCWLLLDFGFYGIGLSSPQFLAKTWGTLNISGPSPPWMTDDNPDTDVYDTFFATSVQALVILNTGSFAGGLLMIATASRLNRVKLQKFGFLVLAALFIALGTVFITIQREGAIAIVLYVVGQLAFNFGPNSTTYILPAELFPTRYRATCHGISAASGKLGSILVQVFSAYYKFGSSSPGADQTKRYGTILVVFSACMFLGAAVTHFWVPEVQRKAPRDMTATTNGSKASSSSSSASSRWITSPGSVAKSAINGRTCMSLEEIALGRWGTKSDAVLRARKGRGAELDRRSGID